jgi:hypothetical protein
LKSSNEKLAVTRTFCLISPLVSRLVMIPTLLLALSACSGESSQNSAANSLGQSSNHLSSLATVSGSLTSTVIGKQSGLCLDIPGAATTSGLAIEQYTCNGTAAQSYTFTPIGNGSYTIKAGTGLCLENMGSESRVEQVSCSGAANQEWIPTLVSGSSYLIAAENGSGCLNVSGGSTSSGGEIITWACSSSSANEIFKLTQALASSGSTTSTGGSTPAPSPSLTVPKASTNGATIPPNNALVDASGNTWTLVASSTEGNQIAEDGTVNPITANVTVLLYDNGQIYQKNAAGTWYVASSSSSIGWVAGTPPTSASGTTLPSAQSIIDSSGNIWTLVASSTEGNQIAENGTVNPITANVTELLYDNGNVYQVNTAGTWYEASSSSSIGWITVTNPETSATPSPSPTATPKPSATATATPTPTATATSTGTGATYYISPTGSDSNSGKTAAAAWLTPNHSVNCGDTILAAAGNYNSTNFGPGQWGTVSCSAGNNVAWLKCETFDTCKINETSGEFQAMSIDESYWGIQGWEVSVSSNVTYGSCFGAGASGYHTANVHHVIFANNVANGCAQGGFATSNLNATASADYVAIVGNIAYNTAQGSTECTSGISIYQPVASDTKAGTHIFVAGNFAYANVDASNCGGTTATDGEAVILDTFNMAYGGGAPYTQQAVVENNIGFFNGGLGFEVNNNNTGSSHATVYFKNNTSYGNMTQTTQEYCSGRAEFMAQTSDNTTLENNIAQTRTGTSCSSDALYAFTTDSPNSTETVNSNWLYSAAGDNDLIVTSSGFSMGSANVLGSTPEFANPVNPGAPSCSGYANVPACMAQVIADYVPKASGASGYGYQPVSSVNVADVLYPQWLCNVNLPSGLVTPGCQ